MLEFLKYYTNMDLNVLVTFIQMYDLPMMMNWDIFTVVSQKTKELAIN